MKVRIGTLVATGKPFLVDDAQLAALVADADRPTIRRRRR